jgi:hypothetical protein
MKFLKCYIHGCSRSDFENESTVFLSVTSYFKNDENIMLVLIQMTGKQIPDRLAA